LQVGWAGRTLEVEIQLVREVIVAEHGDRVRELNIVASKPPSLWIAPPCDDPPEGDASDGKGTHATASKRCDPVVPLAAVVSLCRLLDGTRQSN
jgi:hypothetical protein